MGLSSYFRYMNFFVSFQCHFFLFIGVTLRGALAAWWENKGELVTTSPEFEFPFQFPCCSPSIELSDFRQSARSGNEREFKQTLKTRAKGNDVITNVISANQHFASTFSMQIFKFQRRSCKLRRAFSQAKISPNQCMYVGPFPSLLNCVMRNKVLQSCG